MRVILIVFSHSNKQIVTIHVLTRKFFHLNLRGNIILKYLFGRHKVTHPTRTFSIYMKGISYFENSVSLCLFKMIWVVVTLNLLSFYSKIKFELQ